MNRKIRRGLAGFAIPFFLVQGAAVSLAAPRAQTGSSTTTVIAVTETGGLNVLHSDFRASGRVTWPSDMPKPTVVKLPSRGSFEERLEMVRRGPLGNLKPGRLYLIEGTRLLIYAPGDIAPGFDLVGDRTHATGVVAAAGGREHGTNPDALMIYVPAASPAGWKWLARQGWIDAVSTSYYPLINFDGRCHPTKYVREIVARGRLVFSAAGNVEQAGAASSPPGVPETYQVGGVDAEGRSYVPPRSGAHAAGTPTRPYETGDRFSFPSASPDGLSGSMDFGGTSGATPSTAGRAGDLIEFARETLGSTWTGVRDGALALRAPGRVPPAKGPLADGDLTAAELVDVLHHTAVPTEPPSPLRYLIEGYGAHSNDSIEFATKVLAGTADLPERQDEDVMHERVEEIRQHIMTATACG